MRFQQRRDLRFFRFDRLEPVDLGDAGFRLRPRGDFQGLIDGTGAQLASG